RHCRDPMARPGRPGRQNGVAAAGGRGVQHGQVCPGLPGVRSRAHGRAHHRLQPDQLRAEHRPFQHLL
ncbi:CpXC domain-containing protein, partial [Dysosmobacter welbionis]